MPVFISNAERIPLEGLVYTSALVFSLGVLASVLKNKGLWLTKAPDWGLWILRGGWFLLSGLLAYMGLIGNSLPINSPGEIFLTLGWGIAGVAIFLELVFNHRLPTWAISALTSACLLLAAILKIEIQNQHFAYKPIILIHVGSAIFAYCILAAQALNAFAYLLQDHALAKRQFGGIYSFLPALVPMDRIGTQLMGVAVWMLGLSLIIGAVDWFQNLPNIVTIPKLILSLITWAGCLILLIQRRRNHLSGAAFARGSLYVLIPALIALGLSLPSAK
jgi:ABC-type uncharacterized transport system permease subunit